MQKENKNIRVKKLSKRKKRGLRAVLCFLFILLVWWYNNFSLKITRQDIKYSNVNNEIKIVVLSDQHAEKYGISNSRLIKAIIKEKPDIIFILGDMYSNNGTDERDNSDISLSLMAQLVMKNYPVYFVPGEHDNDENYIEQLSENGVHVMNYKTETILVNETYIQIYGIDNVYFSDTFDLTTEFEHPDKSIFSILMAHVPMYDYYADFGADLTICGDTHGDVARLPFIGPIYDGDKFFPSMLNSDTEIYDKGLFRYDRGNMFITSGIGNYPIPVRLFNRPEIVLISILPDDK